MMWQITFTKWRVRLQFGTAEVGVRCTMLLLNTGCENVAQESVVWVMPSLSTDCNGNDLWVYFEHSILFLLVTNKKKLTKTTRTLLGTSSLWTDCLQDNKNLSLKQTSLQHYTETLPSWKHLTMMSNLLQVQNLVWALSQYSYYQYFPRVGASVTGPAVH